MSRYIPTVDVEQKFPMKLGDGSIILRINGDIHALDRETADAMALAVLKQTRRKMSVAEFNGA